jgi:hypothetical protein
MKKYYFILTFLLFNFSLNALTNESALCENAKKNLKSGDLVFIAIDSYFFKKVAEDTLSWTSHVGLILKSKNNEWLVYESRVPRSTITPFCDYIKRGLDQIVEIKRYKDTLSESDILVLKNEATNRLGYRYNTGFDYDSKNTQFCSKYVFDVFKKINIEVGAIETLKDLFEKNPNTDLAFWKKWYLGRIPWNRRTVTPSSQAKDPQFLTVFENNIPQN